MASIFRPRRGKQATAESQNFVLAKGEIFFEVPTGGVGKGIGRIKMGDGTTAYKNLPYFLQQNSVDVDDSTIAFTESTTTANATLLNEIASGAKLKVIVGSVKKLLRNLDSSVTKLNNDLANIINGTSAVTVSKATNADTATYAKNAGTSNYAKNAGTSNYAKNSSTATNASYAGSASTATYCPKYLPLAGGTLTGSINTRSIWATENDTYNIGASSNCYKYIYGNTHRLFKNGIDYGQFAVQTEGSTSELGTASLWLGNAIPEGTEGNARGQIVMYNNNKNYSVLRSNNNSTANATFVLPKTGGSLVAGAVNGTTLSLYI